MKKNEIINNNAGIKNAQPKTDLQINPCLIEKYYLYQDFSERVLKNSLNNLDDTNVFLASEYQEINKLENIRLIQLNKLVFERDENVQSKLESIYNAAGSAGETVFTILNCDKGVVKIYIGTTVSGSSNAYISFQTLRAAFEGNFPGIKFGDVPDQNEIKTILNKTIYDLADNQNDIPGKSICSVTCIPDIKQAKNKSNTSFIQGIEKLIDAMGDKSYTALFIASKRKLDDFETYKEIYQKMYTEFFPDSKCDFSSGNSTTVTGLNDAKLSDLKNSFNKLRNKIIPGQVIGAGLAVATGVAAGSAATGVAAGSAAAGVAAAGAVAAPAAAIGLLVAAPMIPQIIGTKSETHNENKNFHYENKILLGMLERIDEQLHRFKEFESSGMWEAAAYFISEKIEDCITAANIYKSLVSGPNSGLEQSAVNKWITYNKESDNTKNTINIFKFVRNLQHPIFRGINDSEDSIPISPTAMISGNELAVLMSLPYNSVRNLSVIKHTAFGRNITQNEIIKSEKDANIRLGRVWHMGKCGPSAPDAELSLKSLTLHTFITGSTGSGKSNTIYQILSNACLKGQSEAGAPTQQIAAPENGESGKPTFLVIEPAKGEYKNVFHEVASVYGTNPKKSPLLRLNPFSFPDDTHVLEHIDRLIEIFNACWPMYAAMPAVLKAAIEKAYLNVGWNLNDSYCASGRYPTFFDVIDALPYVIECKGFSSDTQGDYKGALITRIESMTNGINGQVLCSPFELSDTDLFESNVIVDLSRVGSTETKALIMGILILKLQEHRMAQRSSSNPKLKHITVLEEAHHLLRRTSSEQTQESSNLQGKSVEMLANAVAELRSFGEGFIIADQSPGLLDLAVIRNTNTKIIMRLPDKSDCELVGKAAGLNDDQIVELSKLETGVAAVYQNEWLEPVLCKVEEYDYSTGGEYTYDYTLLGDENYYTLLFSLLGGKTNYDELTNEQVDSLQRLIQKIGVREELKNTLQNAVEHRTQVPNPDGVLYRLISGENIVAKIRNENITMQNMAERLMDQYQLNDLNLAKMICNRIVYLEVRLHPEETQLLNIELFNVEGGARDAKF